MLNFSFAIRWKYKGQVGTETLFHTAIGNFQTDLRDWSPAFRDMAGILEADVIEQFETGGYASELSAGWAPLSKSTIRRKGHDTVLMATGNLFRSFQSGGFGHVEEITSTTMRWGSSNPVALFQHTGTLSGFQQKVKNPGRGTPMRKIIELGDVHRQSMRSAMVRNLATIARKTGFAVLSGQVGVDPLTARMAGLSALGL